MGTDCGTIDPKFTIIYEHRLSLSNHSVVVHSGCGLMNRSTICTGHDCSIVYIVYFDWSSVWKSM